MRNVKEMILKQLKDLQNLSDTRPLETEEIKNLETLVKTLKNLPESTSDGSLTDLSDEEVQEGLRLISGAE